MDINRIKLSAIIIGLLIAPLGVFAQLRPAAVVNNFNIEPRSINVPVQVTLRVTVNGKRNWASPTDQSSFLVHCGVNIDRFWWGVYEDLNNQPDNLIRGSNVTFSPFLYRDEPFDFSFQTTLPSTSPGRRVFYAELRCRDNVGRVMTRSANIIITQPGSGGGGGGGTTNPGTGFGFPNPLSSSNLMDLFTGLIDLALRIGLPIAVGIIVYAGIMLLASRGNPGIVTKARTILLWAVVGISVLLIGKGFLTLIESILDLAN